MFATILKFLAEAKKFVTASVGTLAVVLPLLLGSTGTWVPWFQGVVAVLTALGVYVIPNASSAPVVAAATVDLSKAPKR